MPLERKMPEVEMSVETAYGVTKVRPTETCGYAKTEVETMRRYLMDAVRAHSVSLSARMLEWERVSNLTDENVIVEYKKGA